jgi:MFS family permease
MSFTFRRDRDLILVAAGRGASMLGDEIALIALLLWAARLSGGPWIVTGLVLAASVPPLVAAPVAGLMADRIPTRGLVAVLSLGQAMTCVALALAVRSSSVALVLILVALLNLAQAVVTPAWQALIAVIAPGAALPRALSIVQVTTGSALLLGPAVGGVLAGSLGIAAALTVDAATYLAIAAAAVALRTQRRPASQGVKERDPATAGIRLLVADRALRALLVLLAATIVAVGAVNVAQVFLLTRNLDATPTEYGVISALFAIGMIIGATAARRLGRTLSTARLVVAAAFGMTVAVVAFGASPNLTAAAATSMAAGFGNGLLNVSIQTLLLRGIPSDLLGRGLAAVAAVANAAAITATLAGGAMLTVFDPRVVIVACVAVSLPALIYAGRALWKAPETAFTREATPIGATDPDRP